MDLGPTLPLSSPEAESLLELHHVRHCGANSAAQICNTPGVTSLLSTRLGPKRNNKKDKFFMNKNAIEHIYDISKVGSTHFVDANATLVLGK
jgi:hypothetical protein